MFRYLLLAAIATQGTLAAHQCGPECYPLKWDQKYESHLFLNFLDKIGDEEEVGDARFFSVKERTSAEKQKKPLNVEFILHTRSNPVNGQVLNLNDENTFSNFRPLQPTKVVVHGWMSKFWSDFNNNTRDGYLAKGDYNIIHVGWQKISNKLYPSARNKVSEIGEMIGDFIVRLLEKNLIQLDTLHLIGHSLGAHIAGVAGLRVKQVTGNPIDRITGLDPAAPMFSKDQEKRLRRSSASFVDVIHTCGLTLGYFSALGHVDFYPNAGLPIQPGCGFDALGKCSHKRAHAYFTESILKPNSFWGMACDDYSLWQISKCKQQFAFMGDAAERTNPGVYYLRTADKAPYGLGLSSIIF